MGKKNKGKAKVQVVVNTANPASAPKKKKKKARKGVETIVSSGSRISVPRKALRSSLSKGGSTVAMALARSIMNPSMGPVRLATLNDCAPTSVVGLHSYVPINTTTYAGNYPQLGAGSAYAFLFRDPLRAAVVLKCSVAPWAYTAYFPGGTGNCLIPANAQSVEVPMCPLYLQFTSGSAPHGAALFPGEVVSDSGYKGGYVWMNPTDQITTYVSSGSSLQYRFFAWTPAGEEQVGYLASDGNFTLVAAAGSYPGIVSSNGLYIRVSAIPSSTSAGTCGYVLKNTSAASDCFAHLSTVNIVSHLQQLTQARVNAASLLLSNGAAAQYNDGFLQAVNMPSAVPWYGLVQDDDLSGWGDVSNYYSGKFKKGMYTFLKPSEAADMNFYDYTVVDATTGHPAQVGFPLVRSRYVAVRVQSNAYNGSYPGLEYLLNMSMSIEFQTADMWFDAEVPMELSRDVDEARDLLRHVPNFFENPTHLQAIANAIRGAAGFLRKHITKIGGALSILFPKFAPVFGSVSSVLAEPP